MTLVGSMQSTGSLDDVTDLSLLCRTYNVFFFCVCVQFQAHKEVHMRLL